MLPYPHSKTMGFLHSIVHIQVYLYEENIPTMATVNFVLSFVWPPIEGGYYCVTPEESTHNTYMYVRIWYTSTHALCVAYITLDTAHRSFHSRAAFSLLCALPVATIRGWLLFKYMKYSTITKLMVGALHKLKRLLHK